MQSMNIPFLSSLGARRTKHGLGRRATWLMVTLAALFAVLAVAVPTPRSAFADGPSVSITISDPNYETATATITATGVTFDDWTLRVEYETLGEDPYDRYTESKPEFTASDLGSLKFLADYDDDADTLSSTFTLQRLVPDSDYTVLVKLSSSSSSDIYTDTDTFSTKSGCHQEQPGYDRATDPAQERDGSTEVWFGGFNFSKVTRYELVLDVYVSNDTDLIPRNSGRCVYYNYDYHDGAKKVRVPTTGWDSAYVYVKGAGVRAWIKPTPPLIPGTFYDFHVNFDPKGRGAGMGTGESTLGPALIVSVDDIEQRSATVNVALPPGELEDMGERTIHLVYYKAADEYKLNHPEEKPTPEETENGSTSFSLVKLTAGTNYKVQVSLLESFATHQTASKTFTTKLEPPGKPTDLEMAPGDRQLEVSWQAPDGDGVGITGYEVEYRKDGEQSWTTSSASIDEETDTDVTIYKTIISSLDVSTLYDVRVSAVNAAYNWAEGSGTTLPDVPANLEVTPGIRQLALSWGEPAETGTVAITGYVVEYKKTSETSWTSHTTVTADQRTTPYDATISSLDSSAEYDIRVRADNGVTLVVVDDYNWANDSGTTLLDPSADISVKERFQTEATLTVDIRHGNNEKHTVHLRFRDKNADPKPSWIDEDDEPTSTGSAKFTLDSLNPGTTYEVQAWLNDDLPPPDSETFDFPTKPAVTAVSVSDEGQVSAKITVTLVISDIDTSGYAIHVRTSPPGEGKAFTPPPNSLEFTLPGLKSDTDYRVEAWTDNGFDNNAAPHYEFRTTRPTVSNVEVEDSKEQESATATVTIDEPNGEDQIVYLRYRPTTQQDWSTTASDAGEITDVTSDTATASVTIEGIKSDTLYEVEASLESGYDPSETTNFTTAKPSLTGITVGDEEQTKATATISIQAPNGDSLEIYVQYRKVTDPANENWESIAGGKTSSTDDTATAELTGLSSGTEYEAQASLKNTFPDEDGVTVTSQPFTTKGPSLTGLSSEVKMTEATIKVDIQAPNDNSLTINYRYRPTSQTDWSTTATDAGSDRTPSAANSKSASFTLLNLNSSTGYEVQVTLASDWDNPTLPVLETTFTTTTPDPSISGVSIGRKTQTTAVATVTIALPGTGTNTAHVRYQALGATAWSTQIFEGDATDATATVNITGLDTDTNYQAKVSLSSGFTSPWVVSFKTIPYPSVRSVAVTDFDKTTAEVTVAIDDEDGVSREVHLRYIVYSENPDWTNDGITTKTDDNGADTATKDLEDLSPGTTYILEASYDTNFVTGVEDTEFTTKPNPSVGSVKADTVTKTTARAVVEIAHHDDTELTVELRYQVKVDVQDWTDSDNVGTAQAISSENPATKVLEDLSPGTEYVLQASFDSDFPDDGTKKDTFTTKHAPSIYSISIDRSQTSARATITIANPDGTPQDVKLQYREKDATPVAEWDARPVLPGSSTDATARIDINGLTANTRYDVQAWLATDENNKVTDTFRTLQNQPPPPVQNSPPPQRSPVVPNTPPPPSVTDVTFDNKTQNSADATVDISNEGKTKNTLRLHYRVEGTTEWDAVPAKITSGTSEIMPLTSLTAGATHEVQAWLDSSLPPAGTKIYEFDTLDELAPVPDAAISNLKCENIGQTSATAMVEIANAGTDMKEVFLKHSIQGEDEWTMLPFPTITYDDDTSIPLTGLTEGTTYEVAVALSDDFSGMVIEQCTTLLLDPVVSGISVDRRKQTSVWANVSIANANGEDQTVHLRYRTTTPQGEWSDSAKTTTSTDSASKEIAGLTADTEYEVQASLDGTFPDELTKNATFTTLRFPSISNLKVEDETKSSATTVITIADPDGSSQTIHLRYRTTTPQGEWSSTRPGRSTTSEASIALTGLAPDTEYEAEVSLTSDFAVAVSDVFRTLPPDPVVSKVSVNSIRQTTATASIDIANTNGSTHTVSLRYRTTTPRGDWIDDLKTTSDTETASKELSGLTAGTEYDVQASLDDSFPATRTKLATFTTLRWPSIASFEVENVGRNGATVNATIADSHGAVQTVYVRHRATSYIAWRPTQQVDSVGDIASLRLRGLSSGTEYIAEASLNESFPSDETKSVTFTTVKRKDDDDASSSGSGTVQAARAENIPLPGFSPQMLRFVAIEGGDNPASQTFSVWNRAQGIMNFTLSNHEEWLYQDPLSGVSTGPADVVAISASVDISGLPEGQYVDVINIQISPAGRSPGQVIVVLDVLPPDYIRQFVSRDEGGIVVLPDGTVRLIVPPDSPPKDVDIELMKLNTEAHGEPLRDSERVVVAIESNTYEPDGDTPEDVAYTPAVELWVELPEEDAAACDESRARVYSVKYGAWSLIEHRCETDESGHAWAVTQVERLGQFALVIDDAPVVATPTPVAAAVAPTPTAIPASAPAVIVQRISLPAQPPTPTPTQIPTPMPLPNGKRASVQTIGPAPTQIAVPAATESLAQTLQASSEDGDSGSFGSIVLAAIGAPLIIGLFIVGYLAYRERRRTGNPNL